MYQFPSGAGCSPSHRHPTQHGHFFLPATTIHETEVRTAQPCDLLASIQKAKDGLVPARLHYLFFHLFLLAPLSVPVEPLWSITRTKFITSRRVGAPRSPTLCAQFGPEPGRRLVQGQ